jgi:predicted nuclease with TOPRIM domain
MDAPTLTALGGLIVGLVSAVVAAYTARNSATRAEVDSLRVTIKALVEENDRLRKRLAEIETINEQKNERIDLLEGELELMRQELDGYKRAGRRKP